MCGLTAENGQIRSTVEPAERQELRSLVEQTGGPSSSAPAHAQEFATLTAAYMTSASLKQAWRLAYCHQPEYL